MQVRILLLIACVVATINASSWGPKRVCPVSWSCFGFWEYLPDSYNTANADKHPVIVTLHGLGEYGNGQAPDINKIITTSLPKYINNNQWPASWDFLVFAPQDFNGWWNAARVTQVIDWIANNYPKADLNRVYLTGYSAGGGGTWDFVVNGNASRVAAIAPICGSGGSTPAGVTNIVANNVPVWAFHNSGDPTVNVGITNTWINNLNAAGIVPTALKTIYTSNSHDAWTAAYNPASSPMYAWFLNNSRAGPAPTAGPTSAPTAAPTPNPCPAASIGTGTGLMGVYYSGRNFTSAKGARVDSTVNFSWGSTGIPTLATTEYSVRWTGTLRAKFSGVHTFYTTSDDGVRLKIDGATVIENWTDHGSTENSGTVTLTAGASYPVVLEFYNGVSGAVISLSWAATCLPKEIIPATQLTPGALNIC